MINEEENEEKALFQWKHDNIHLRQDLGQETIWADKKQIATIFGIDRSFVSRHIKTIFSDQ